MGVERHDFGFKRQMMNVPVDKSTSLAAIARRAWSGSAIEAARYLCPPRWVTSPNTWGDPGKNKTFLLNIKNEQ